MAYGGVGHVDLQPMGHEYVGVVEEIGDLKPRDGAAGWQRAGSTTTSP